MTIDVLIPTYKPDKEFIKLIQLLLKQTVKIHRIIIMNTEEQFFEPLLYENSKLLCQPQIEMHHISQKEFDHGGTRHQGMKYSKADICVCMTQDAVPCDVYMLEKLTAPLADEQIAVCYARQLPKADSGLLEQFSRSYNYPQESKSKTEADVQTMGIKAFFCSDVCAAYNRKKYFELGGFIRHTIFNEDMIFARGALRAGYTVYYAAEAMVYHSHEYSFGMQLRRNFDLGVSQADNPQVFAVISSEKEGKKMILAACKHFISIRKPWIIVKLVMQSAAKYVGYFLGKRYKKLPERLIDHLTTNKGYWRQYRQKHEHEVYNQGSH